MSGRAKKKRGASTQLCFGGIAVAAGCLIRSLQLIGSFFGVRAFSGRYLYVAMLCLLCGGFAVVAYEKKGRASLFAMIASISSLMTTVMGNMSNGSDGLRVLSAVFLVLFMAAAGLYCINASGGKGVKSLLGAAILLLALACGIFAAGLSPLPEVTLCVLVSTYLITGVAVAI